MRLIWAVRWCLQLCDEIQKYRLGWFGERMVADELEVLTILIERYEDIRYPIPASDPVEAIKFRMEQQGLTPKDLEVFIGSSGRVSEVLSGKRGLSLRMIKRLHEGLKIPYESLMAAVA